MLIINVIGILLMMGVFIGWHFNFDSHFLPLILVIGMFLYLFDQKTKDNFSRNSQKHLKWYDIFLNLSLWWLGGVTASILDRNEINIVHLLFSDLYFVVSLLFLLILFLVRRYYKLVLKQHISVKT